MISQTAFRACPRSFSSRPCFSQPVRKFTVGQQPPPPPPPPRIAIPPKAHQPFPFPPGGSSRATNILTFVTASALGAGAYYYQWKKHKDGIFNPLATKDSPSEGLSIEKWTPILLTNITKVSDHTSLFEFQLPEPCNIPITSAIYVKDNETHAMRAYTPIHASEKGQSTVKLLIKRYSEGQVSRFMHSAKPGQKIEMRGPVLIWPGSSNDVKKWDEICMIAGGTGITAFLPILYSVLDNPDSKTKVSLLLASQSEDELYFKEELDRLAAAHPDKLRIAYAVDRLPETGSGTDIKWKGYVGYIRDEMLKDLLPKPITTGDKQKSIILVCGPETMVKHVAGARGMSGHEPICGELGSLGYQRDQVFRFPN